MKNTKIYATCTKHGDLTLAEVNRGGIMRSGKRQYRCKLCNRADQQQNYAKHKLQLKKYYAQRNMPD